MAETVAPLVIDIEGMMRMFHRRDPAAAPRQLRHQLFDQRSLARILETGNADDFVHGLNSATIRRASASSS